MRQPLRVTTCRPRRRRRTPERDAASCRTPSDPRGRPIGTDRTERAPADRTSTGRRSPGTAPAGCQHRTRAPGTFRRRTQDRDEPLIGRRLPQPARRAAEPPLHHRLIAGTDVLTPGVVQVFGRSPGRHRRQSVGDHLSDMLAAAVRVRHRRLPHAGDGQARRREGRLRRHGQRSGHADHTVPHARRRRPGDRRGHAGDPSAVDPGEQHRADARPRPAAAHRPAVRESSPSPHQRHRSVGQPDQRPRELLRAG